MNAADQKVWKAFNDWWIGKITKEQYKRIYRLYMVPLNKERNK